jgi:predicted metal-binding membrane protein
MTLERVVAAEVDARQAVRGAMLLMFAVGMGSLAWMFALGALMAIEKNAARARGMSRPLGIVLIGAGATLMLAAFIPTGTA